METKVCSKCKEEKEVCEFRVDKQKKDGLYSSCKLCCKQLRDNNVEKYLNNSEKWYNNNRDLSNLKSLEWNKSNPEKFKKSQKNWEKKNRLQRNLYSVTKRKNNPLSRLSENIRTRVRNFLLLNKITKKSKTFDIVGCSPEFLKEHLEKQFKNNMSWDNYGVYGWHIDHIIPLSSAKTEDEIYKLCHYTNLQPLWAEENLSKGSKIL
jgi:hypothetical protein